MGQIPLLVVVTGAIDHKVQGTAGAGRAPNWSGIRSGHVELAEAIHARIDTKLGCVAFEMSRFSVVKWAFDVEQHRDLSVIKPVRGQQRIVWLHRARRDRGGAETVVVMAVFVRAR